MSEVILKAVTDLGENVKTQIDAVKDEAGKAAEKAEKGIDEVKSSLTVVKDETEKKFQEVNEKLTEIQKKANRIGEQPKGGSFKDQLGEELEKKKDALANYGKNDRRAVGMEVKVVGNLGSGNTTTSGTQNFVDPTRMGAVGRKPYEAFHIRNIPGVNVIPISTDSAFVIRDQAGEGGPTAVAMAAAKPQSDRDYQKLIVPVTKIAHYFKIPEEMLADIDWLQSEITAVGVEELLSKEDDLILNQAAAAGLFAGLTTATNSTAFAAPAELALAVDLANNYDVLIAAWTQLLKLNNTATGGLVAPGDYAKMILTKESATNGSYVFGAPNVAIPNIMGVPLFPTNRITTDKFLFGDFSKVRIGQRAGVSVRFYDQNEDDALKNMVTIVIEERLTVVVDRLDRLIYGDFSDARAALETA